MADYLRVIPTSEQLDAESIPRVLDSLHKLTMPGSSGLGAKLNPLHSDTPPRFEFLAISDGPDEPVEFFYGADAHLDTLEKRLRSIYPSTFDIERVDIDVAGRLIQPVEFTPQEFVDHYEAGRLQYEFGPGEQYEHVDEGPADADAADPIHSSTAARYPPQLPSITLSAATPFSNLPPPRHSLRMSSGHRSRSRR